MKITKGEFQLNRFFIPYRIYGESEEKIVCICGAQQTMASWRSFVSKLSKDFSITVFDLPGHGRAKILYGPPSISLDEQIDVIHKVILKTNGEQPIKLAAASWGSILGAGYASRYPHMVERLILGSFGGRTSNKMLQIIEEGQVLVRENKGAQLGHLIIDNFGQGIPDIIKKTIISQFQQMEENHFLAFYANAELIKNTGEINNKIDLNKISAKTLIVNGELDTIINLDDTHHASAQIADCELKVIPNTGHFLHLERKKILEVYHEFFMMNNAFCAR